jgi:hypothetical protein
MNMIDSEPKGWEDRPRVCSRAINLPPWMCNSSSEGAHGDVRAKRDGEGIQRQPVAKRPTPRPSRSQELVLTAHDQNADYSHFEQNRNGESFLKNPLPGP